jgi:hypothetical protein
MVPPVKRDAHGLMDLDLRAPPNRLRRSFALPTQARVGCHIPE